MQDEAVRLLITALVACSQTGSLGDLQIEYWFGGGPPPPYYRSEQLLLVRESNRDLIQYSELQFDDRYDPSSITLRYRIDAQESQIREFARLLLDKKLFESTYPEERKIQDSHAFEFLVTKGDVSLTKKYFRVMPEELVELSQTANSLIRLVIDNGELQYLHQGKQIQGYSPPAAP